MPLNQLPLEQSSKCLILFQITLLNIFLEASIFRVSLFRWFVGGLGVGRSPPDGEAAPGYWAEGKKGRRRRGGEEEEEGRPPRGRTEEEASPVEADGEAGV